MSELGQKQVHASSLTHNHVYTKKTLDAEDKEQMLQQRRKKTMDKPGSGS